MGIRGRYLPPLIAGVALIMGGLMLWVRSRALVPLLPWIASAGALVVLPWLLLERQVRRPLRHLSGNGIAGDELGGLKTRIDDLQRDLRNRTEELTIARVQRQGAENALREHEQRYLMAVKGATDGLWELDVGSGAMILSPRWKSMLGFGIDDVAHHVDAWTSLIHPEDRITTTAALEACVAGRSEGFEVQHRVVASAGEVRWIASRGTVLRRASGRPYRVLGMDTDVSRLRRMEEILQHVAQGTASTTGEAFFRELVRHFAAVIGVRQAFITECVDYPATRVRPLATWDSGQFIEDPVYELAQTPCEEVIQCNHAVYVPSGIEQRFACSARQGFTSYLGLPIVGSSGRVIGHLAFQGPEPIREELASEAIYRIFVARAGAELERRQEQQVLLDLASGLSRCQGDAVFEQVARAFALLTGMREAFVTECLSDPPDRVRMLAWWHSNQFLPPVEYDVAGSVCEETLRHARICHHAHGVRRRFGYGEDPGWDAYLGVPILDAQGRVMGHLAAADVTPSRRPAPNEAALMLLRERTAMEMLRRRLGTSPATASQPA